MIVRPVRTHFHFFCGAGGFAKGINQAEIRLGVHGHYRWRCIGGIDNDPGACADFSSKYMAGVPATCADLFSREQYEAFHGREPPKEWREFGVDDLLAVLEDIPDLVALSAPCKGFSGLLSQSKSETARYQALNELSIRGLWLMLEAAKKRGKFPKFFLFENVPRISVRGRPMLDQIIQLLGQYGYAARETRHNCGEIGRMAESRERFLLIARHVEQVPSYLYEPRKHPLQAVGTVLGRMLLPGDPKAGPMHRVPSLNWKTWVRLAFVEAGRDWRSLNKLKVEDGVLKDYALMREASALHVDDMRFTESDKWNTGHAYGVKRWNQHAACITKQADAGQGYFAVSDPRPTREKCHNNVFRVVRWSEVGRSVTAGGHPTSGGVSVADPRTGYGPNSHRNKLAVVSYDKHAGTVTGSDRVGSGALSVADPRTGMTRAKGDNYLTNAHYGVVPWDQPSGTVTGRLSHDNGPGNVADPRAQHESDQRELFTRGGSAPSVLVGDRSATEVPSEGAPCLPEPSERLVCVIKSLDNTWHRPFTTLDLACLQGMVEPEEHLELSGNSDRAWRERIGNLVPPPAAKAIGQVLLQAIALSDQGETFILSDTPVWVREVALAIAMPMH